MHIFICHSCFKRLTLRWVTLYEVLSILFQFDPNTLPYHWFFELTKDWMSSLKIVCDLHVRMSSLSRVWTSPRNFATKCDLDLLYPWTPLLLDMELIWEFWNSETNRVIKSLNNIIKTSRKVMMIFEICGVLFEI